MNNPDYKKMIHDINTNSFNVMDQYKELESVDLIREYQPKHNFSVCCANVTGDMNLSNIIRSAVIFGCDKVYIVGRKSFDRRGMVGANNYIDIEFVGSLTDDLITPDWDSAISHIQSENYEPVFVETGGSSMNRSILGKKPCFIFGNEGLGIPENVLEKYNQFDIITIPMYGVMRSLNVATAAGIVMSKYNDFYIGD